MRAVIFDIDGTLSDPSHRLHHIRQKPHNWPAFFDALGDDPAHEPIVWLAQIIKESGVPVLLTTGRPESHREQTEKWLQEAGVRFNGLYMRPTDDYRADHIVKSQMLDGIIADGFEIALVVDDRQSVVDMWRARGLTCLQCREPEKISYKTKPGQLTLMVGPSGAGKSTWLQSAEARDVYGIKPDHIVSSDGIRAVLCTDFRDQTKNEEVFATLHAIVLTRLSHGLPVVVDATNLRRKDRLAIVGLTRPDAPVRYIVIDRPMVVKRADAGWRANLSFDLLAKHDQTFKSQIKDILAGDGAANVTVADLRAA